MPACYCYIGYGNLVPTTAGGRAFTVLYALLGIPLQLVTLAAIGWWFSRALDLCFFRPCRFGDDRDRSTWSLGKHVVRMLISCAVFLVFFALIPACAFQYLENWTFGVGVYFALITLTTIGFGDYEVGSFYYCCYRCCWWWIPGGRPPYIPYFPVQQARGYLPAKEHHCPLTSTKLNCLVTAAHECEQLD